MWCICVLYFSSLLSSLLSWDPVQPDLLWAEFPKDHLYILLTAKPCFIHTWYYDMVGVMHPMEPGAEDLEVARRGGSWGYQATAQEIWLARFLVTTPSYLFFHLQCGCCSSEGYQRTIRTAVLLLAILPVPTTALLGIIMGSLMGTVDFFPWNWWEPYIN